MNLWGFTPSFHQFLRAAMDAATGASEEAEVLLPDVVAQALAATTFLVLPATGPVHRRHPSRRPGPGPGRHQRPDCGHGERPAAPVDPDRTECRRPALVVILRGGVPQCPLVHVVPSPPGHWVPRQADVEAELV